MSKKFFFNAMISYYFMKNIVDSKFKQNLVLNNDEITLKYLQLRKDISLIGLIALINNYQDISCVN